MARSQSGKLRQGRRGRYCGGGIEVAKPADIVAATAIVGLGWRELLSGAVHVGYADKIDVLGAALHQVDGGDLTGGAAGELDALRSGAEYGQRTLDGLRAADGET